MSARTTEAPRDDVELLDAARGGDQEAFGRIVESHRGMLEAHCRRMLGSSHDVEDAVQETLIKAWRALPRFRGQSSLRTWLHRIATNVCIDAIHRRPQALLEPHHPARWLDADAEPGNGWAWSDARAEQEADPSVSLSTPAARYEQREAVERAFTVTLQQLSPKQRAALILRDVFGFSAKEVAELMETSVPSVTSALQRARRELDRPARAGSGGARVGVIAEPRTRRLVEDFASAVETGDVPRVLGLLSEDAPSTAPRQRDGAHRVAWRHTEHPQRQLARRGHGMTFHRAGRRMRMLG